MIASRVTPLTEEEGPKVDGVEEVRGIADPDHLEHGCASLHLTVVKPMAHITWTWLEMEKGTEKWRKILVIVEEKMSFSWVIESLYIFRMERIK